MSNVENLKSKKTYLKGIATRLDNFISQVNSETSIFEVRARLENLEKIYDQFQSLDIEMSAHPENFPQRETEMEEFETRYFRMKTKFNEFVDARTHSTPLDQLNSTTMQQDAMQKLLETQTAFLEKLSALRSSVVFVLKELMLRKEIHG